MRYGIFKVKGEEKKERPGRCRAVYSNLIRMGFFSAENLRTGGHADAQF